MYCAFCLDSTLLWKFLLHSELCPVVACKQCRGQTSFRIIRTSTPAPEGYILISSYFTTLFVTTKTVLPRLTGRACFLGAADSSNDLKGESFTGCYPPTPRYSAGTVGRNLIEARSTTSLCRIHCFQSTSPGDSPPSSTDRLSPAKRAQRPSFQKPIFTRRYKHPDSLTAVSLV